MIWFFVTIPIMIVAAAIATVPILYHSVREHRLLNGESVPARRPVPRSPEYRTRPARARVAEAGPERSAAA